MSNRRTRCPLLIKLLRNFKYSSNSESWYFNLENNKIKSKGTSYLAHSLKQNKSLQELNISKTKEI